MMTVCIHKHTVCRMPLKPDTQSGDLYHADSPFRKLAIGMSDYNVLVECAIIGCRGGYRISERQGGGGGSG